MRLKAPKAGSLAILAVCQVAAMGLWFSASAVVPTLTLEYGLADTRASWLTSSVQAGFVAGTFASAVLGLADRIDPRRLFMASTLVAAGANAAVLLVDPTSQTMLLLRFLTGACMAGVYPVGMKLASTWAKGDLGLIIGLMVGALTLGSASPHLFNAFGGLDWRLTIAVASGVAVMAALLINMAELGPLHTPAVLYDSRAALNAWTDKPLRLANIGYLGHMWELYAMWAWLGVFLDASFQLRPGGGDAALWARLASFAAMGLGGRPVAWQAASWRTAGAGRR